jgi:hypothetical protein
MRSEGEKDAHKGPHPSPHRPRPYKEAASGLRDELVPVDNIHANA